MPELSEHKKNGKSQCCNLILQICGITTGIAIMLIIALYEHDIKNLLGDDMEH